MEKRYSEVIITDDNSDEEVEKLIDMLGKDTIMEYDTFEQQLPDKFMSQMNPAGFTEYIKYKNEDGCQTGKLAYEFGNGFMIFDFFYIL